MTNKLEGKKIVIAGGSSGIGLSLVGILAEEKAQVTVIGRDPAKLKAVKEKFPSVTGISLDAEDKDALEKFFSEEKEIDHLVIALSGAKGAGLFKTLSLADLREGFEKKFWPQLQVLQTALPVMNPTGSITLITAISATAKLPGTSGLAAINGGLEAMVPVLSRELAPMRINAVSPGVIDTTWWDFLPDDAKQKTFEEFSTKIGVGRVGRPEEVAGTIHHLIVTEYINGVIIGCHGGLN
ncbi:SDR family oxidoreductase [Flavitalea flava]